MLYPPILHPQQRQPPCEAVNWNMLMYGSVCSIRRQPPCEAVNWNVQMVLWGMIVFGQPPCEAVNWNIHRWKYVRIWNVSLLARLWIEIDHTSIAIRYISVSLLARLWIEIFSRFLIANLPLLSASLRGCELKYSKVVESPEVVPVSLLARLWIEMLITDYIVNSGASASLRGCELK